MANEIDVISNVKLFNCPSEFSVVAVDCVARSRSLQRSARASSLHPRQLSLLGPPIARRLRAHRRAHFSMKYIANDWHSVCGAFDLLFYFASN